MCNSKNTCFPWFHLLINFLESLLTLLFVFPINDLWGVTKWIKKNLCFWGITTSCTPLQLRFDILAPLLCPVYLLLSELVKIKSTFSIQLATFFVLNWSLFLLSKEHSEKYSIHVCSYLHIFLHNKKPLKSEA